MRDGYYLSTYLHVNPLFHLYGIKGRHDQNISLWKKDGSNIELVHYWELERITGHKMHNLCFFSKEHVREFVNNLLSNYNLTLNQIAGVFGTPELDTFSNYHSINKYPNLAYHSISHLYSGLLMDTEVFYNNNIIALAVDGGPDDVVDNRALDKFYYAGSYSEKGRIIDVFDVCSPGRLWTFLKRKFSLREGTLMALGSACSSTAYIESIPMESLLVKDRTTKIRIEDSINKLINSIFSLSEKDSGKKFNGYDPRFSEQDNKISMVVKEIQNLSLKVMEFNIDNIINKYNVDPKDTVLSITGGYALNCPSNSYLINKYNFKQFISPPCVSDCGQSLGSALYYFFENMDKMNFKLNHAFYGSHSTIEEIEPNFYNFIDNITDFCLQTAVNDIQNEPVVWFNGRAELGPRALGNRSILADPRHEKTKERLNEIKQRQWWRPVAPIVLEELVNDWFEEAFPSPFMLNTFKIKKEYQRYIPAVTHLDGSARVQTINNYNQPLLYELICEFKKITGIPMICNTSLNDHQEPIINTVQEAINFALRKKINVMYVNGKRVLLRNHSSYASDQPLNRKDSLLFMNDQHRQEFMQELNPYNLSQDLLELYIGYLHLDIDLKNKKCVRKIQMLNTLRKKYKIKIANVTKEFYDS